MDEVRFFIDGHEVWGQRHQTVLDVALANGIDIPHLCYHPRLSAVGACRLCLVRVDGRMLRPACTEFVIPDMQIVTEDEGIRKSRRWILESLLMEGEHNCLYCDASGECLLQRYVQMYDVKMPTETLINGPRTIDLSSSKALRRDETRCILCGRCVRACREVQVSNVWGFGQRGAQTRLIADDDKPIGDSSCMKCGLCAQMCPTGALTLQPVLGRGATWDQKKESTICIYCGVGCKIDYHTNLRGELVRATGNMSGPNTGHLCVKGRFGFDFAQSDKRLTKPLLKKGERFKEVEWDEALDFVARRLGEIRDANGADSIGALSSAKCTNEENYVLQKFLRAIIGTNNVDHCARL